MFPTTTKRSSTTEDRTRLELWIPADLAEIYPDVAPTVQASLTPYGAEGWFAPLAGLDVVGAPAVSDLSRSAMKGTLARHLASAIADDRYDGVAPGSVSPPPRHSAVGRPVQLRDGTPSTFMTELSGDAVSDEDKRQRELYQWSEAHRGEYHEAVLAATLEVLTDMERAWTVHVHLAALDVARRELTARATAARNEAARLARDQCPICGDSEASRIGPVADRSLLPGQDLPAFGDLPATVRSCLACWNVASSGYVLELAGEQMTGGRSRASLVRSSLRESDKLVARIR